MSKAYFMRQPHSSAPDTRLTIILVLCLLALAACSTAPAGPLTVTLVADGESRSLTTEVQTVRELLLQAGITLDDDDRVSPPENGFLHNGLTVQVIRVEVQTESEEQVIPYERETVRDFSIPVGETRLLQAGINGIEEFTYAVTLEDGAQVDRRLVQRTMLQEAQTEIVLVGARQELTAAPISGTITYVSNQNAWVMRGTSGNRRRLTATGDLDGRVFALSSDGSQLLYSSQSSTETLNVLWMVNTVAADAEPVRLQAENVLWAAWAPDGETVAYSTGIRRDAAPGWEALNDLYVGRPRASDGQIVGRRRILDPSSGGSYGWWGTTFAWTPGEAEDRLPYLAYARADEVGVVQPHAEQSLVLARFPPYRTYGAWAWTPSISWAPAGDFIATVIHAPSSTGEMPEDSPVFDLYALDVQVEENGTITTTLTAKLAAEVGMWSNPSFSPSGDLILFGQARAPYTSQTSAYELWRMDRDGSDRRLLFPSNADEPGLEYPVVAWDPQGGRVAVVYQGDIYLVTLSGESRRVTDDGSISTVRWAGVVAPIPENR
ncbi:MAG: G5 domain-containing protein [Anaerolineae bacterium]|nr:G5 domain-containing protein [Anaerolineae bacterium]